MRYLIALSFCFLLISPQVHACLGASLENTLFFKTIPNPQPNADVIAIVSLSGITNETPTAKVIKLLKVSNARVHKGDKIAIKYEVSSCGPNHVNGEHGIIIAKVGADSKGRLVLYPYMRRYEDGRISQPSMNE